MTLFKSWRVKRVIKLGELAKMEFQSQCTHDWRYIGEEFEEIYNGIYSELFPIHKVYCPKCDAEETHNTKSGTEQLILKAKLRMESLQNGK